MTDTIDQALRFTAGHMRAAAKLLDMTDQAMRNAVNYHTELACWRKKRGYQASRLPFRIEPVERSPRFNFSSVLGELRLAQLLKKAEREKLLLWLNRQQP